jgi:hypothetical protein
MAYEMRAGQGSLFKNDKKTTDSQPTLKGRVMLPNGEVRWISGWTKKTSAGESWISLSVGELCMQQQQGGGGYNQAPYGAPAQPKAAVPDNDDDIPF